MAALVHLVWVTRRQTEQNQQSSYVPSPEYCPEKEQPSPFAARGPCLDHRLLLGAPGKFGLRSEITFVNSPRRCGLPVERTQSLRWNIVGSWSFSIGMLDI